MDFTAPLSPQAMGSLRLGFRSNPNYDKEKNDVWATGVTVIASLFNEDFNTYYDWSKYEVKYQVI